MLGSHSIYICILTQFVAAGLNRRLAFASFAPRWNAPFSSTVDIGVASKFSDGHGVILKLAPGPGSNDRYYDVEWLSDFEWERERLFVTAFQLRIVDIGYFQGETLRQSGWYLRAFTLFSALFRGDFVSEFIHFGAQSGSQSARKKKEQKSPEKMLLNLIRNYKANNSLISNVKDGPFTIHKRPRDDDSDDAADEMTESVESVPNGMNEVISKSFTGIPVYIQQLFYQLIRAFKYNVHSKHVIPSEYDKLSKSLKKEFFEETFSRKALEQETESEAKGDDMNHMIGTDDENQSQIVMKICTRRLSPFLKAICKPKAVKWMKEFVWTIEGVEFEELKAAKSDQRVFSPKFEYVLSKTESMYFRMWFKRKTGGTSYAGIGIIMEDGKGMGMSKVNGKMALMIGEMKWIKNDYVLRGMETGIMRGTSAFEDYRIDKVQSINVRIACYFTIQKTKSLK